MSRCRQTDALLDATFSMAGLTRAQASHAASCRACAQELAASRRFGVELHRAAELMVRDAESDSRLRDTASLMRGGGTMRSLVAVLGIVVIVLIVGVGYGGGRWMGSFIDIGFDHSAPLVDDRAADEEAERARAQAEEAAVRAEVASRAAIERRAAAEAVPSVEEPAAPIPDPQADDDDAALASAACGAWATMTDDEQLRAVKALVGHVLERVRAHQQLPAGADASVIIAAARASLDKGCQGSPDDRKLVEIARWLFGGGR